MASWVYLHNIDPFAIAFTENFGIRWYGLAYVSGFLAAYFFMILLSKTGKTTLSQRQISSFINYSIVGILLGGRLGYCLFYRPELWLEFHSSFPFWGVLEIHKGGMASHGGILGLIIALGFFSKWNKISFFHVLDMAVVGGSCGIFLGRIANFINGELYGRIIQGKAWIGVQFPKEILSWYSNKEKLLTLKPVINKIDQIKSPFGNEALQVNEVLWETWIYSKEKYTAEIFSILKHITNSVEKGKMEIIQALNEVLPIRHPSQIYQSLLEGLIPALIVMFLWWKPPTLKRGVIAGVWASLYIIMRTLGEVFREPDAQFGFEALGLTRGQWLSLIFIIPVAIYFYIIHHQSRKKSA